MPKSLIEIYRELMEKQQSYTDAIKNIADRNTPEYKALESTFLALHYNLPENAKPETRTKLEISRIEYLHTLRLASPVDYLAHVNERVSLSTRDVHGGSSEFTEAEKSLIKLEKEYRMLQSFGKYTPPERVEQQLIKVRKDMQEAAEKITKYLDYKAGQKSHGKRLNTKANRRIHSMRLSLDALEELKYAIDDKAAELEANEFKRETAQLEAEQNGPEKTKEELIAEIRQNLIHDPDVDTFLQNLDTLNTSMDDFMKPDQATGWMKQPSIIP